MNPLIRFRSKAYSLSKELYQIRKINGPDTRTVLFIIGCQRSGTSLMTRIFNKDWNAKVYFEDSNLSVQVGEEKLRLKPLPFLKQVIDRERFPLIVLKPLVETQNVGQFLNYFPNSKAVWLFRHYKDVARSNLMRFGLDNGIRDLRYIAKDRIKNWRVENLPDWVKQIVLSYFSETMNPYDAAALFWYVRNTFFFELGLDCHPRVIPCKYTDLVLQPKQTMEAIYTFIGLPYPGDHIQNEVHTSSVNNGQKIELSEEIERMCEQLWNRLNGTVYDPLDFNGRTTLASLDDRRTGR